MPELKMSLRELAAIALAAVMSCVAALSAAPAVAGDAVELRPDLWRFERAEVAKSETRKRPAQDAEWTEVVLPESWSETFPGYRGQVWYRMRVDLKEVPRDPYAIYVPN